MAKDKIDPLVEGIFIGHNYGQPGRFFEGAIDEVVIYNRALSDEEVEELFGGAIKKKLASVRSKGK